MALAAKRPTPDEADPVRPAEEGTQFTDADGYYFKVGPKCSMNVGRWFCITHPDESLHNQFQKDIHIGHGQHELTWWCGEHGPEVP